MYSENLMDFPNGSFSFTNLVLANVTSHTQILWQQFKNKSKMNKKIINVIFF